MRRSCQYSWHRQSETKTTMRIQLLVLIIFMINHGTSDEPELRCKWPGLNAYEDDCTKFTICVVLGDRSLKATGLYRCPYSFAFSEEERACVNEKQAEGCSAKRTGTVDVESLIYVGTESFAFKGPSLPASGKDICKNRSVFCVDKNTLAICTDSGIPFIVVDCHTLEGDTPLCSSDRKSCVSAKTKESSESFSSLSSYEYSGHTIVDSIGHSIESSYESISETADKSSITFESEIMSDSSESSPTKKPSRPSYADSEFMDSSMFIESVWPSSEQSLDSSDEFTATKKPKRTTVRPYYYSESVDSISYSETVEESSSNSKEFTTKKPKRTTSHPSYESESMDSRIDSDDYSDSEYSESATTRKYKKTTPWPSESIEKTTKRYRTTTEEPFYDEYSLSEEKKPTTKRKRRTTTEVPSYEVTTKRRRSTTPEPSYEDEERVSVPLLTPKPAQTGFVTRVREQIVTTLRSIASFFTRSQRSLIGQQMLESIDKLVDDNFVDEYEN